MLEFQFETVALVLACVATLWVVYIGIVNLFGVEDTERWGYTSWYIHNDTKLKRMWHWTTYYFTYWSLVGTAVTGIMVYMPNNHYPLSWLTVAILTIGVVGLWCHDRYRHWLIMEHEKRWHGPEQRCNGGAQVVANLVERIRATTGKKVDPKTFAEWREILEGVIKHLVPNQTEQHRIVGNAVERLREYDAANPAPTTDVPEEA
jgi:hypothetical protein